MSWKQIPHKCPCAGCDQRSGGCHDSCAGYMAWAEERRAEKKAVVPIAEAYTLATAKRRKERRINKK